ncbi:retrovirus-related pol polyprotein from transposon TNT 1-94 [Tanacetum coccineum]
MVKRDVEIETVGEGVDEIDKLTELTGEMQLKQEDQGCVHASNELQLHVVPCCCKLEGKNVIALKWLWKNKCDADNIVVQNKTRLVAKGYKQEEGIDFEESFAPVARLELLDVHLLLLSYEYHIFQMDVKRFSHATLKEKKFMSANSEGFIDLNF